MLIPSLTEITSIIETSLSRRVNANSQHDNIIVDLFNKLIKKGEC